jgi:hypothetical protein
MIIGLKEQAAVDSVERNPVLRELSGMLVALPLVLLLSLPETTQPEPLLVVVESNAGEAPEAPALRGAIARELGLRVLSPAEEEPAEDVAIVTVALAQEQAVTVFRRRGTTIRRVISLPADGPRRLRLVTWLVGNLVRDQTSDLVHDQDDAARRKAAAEGPPEDGADAPVAPLPTPPAPRVSPAPSARSSAPPSIAASARPPAAVGRWTIAALTGRGIFDSDRINCNCGSIWSGEVGGRNELEVTRRGPSLALGGTLITGFGYAAGLTLGWHRSLLSWLAPELGATFGLWAYEGPSFGDYNQTDWKADLFARVTAGVAFSPTSWLDVVARLSLSGEMSRDKYLGFASVGLRCSLP